MDPQSVVIVVLAAALAFFAGSMHHHQQHQHQQPMYYPPPGWQWPPQAAPAPHQHPATAQQQQQQQKPPAAAVTQQQPVAPDAQRAYKGALPAVPSAQLDPDCSAAWFAWENNKNGDLSLPPLECEEWTRFQWLARPGQTYWGEEEVDFRATEIMEQFGWKDMAAHVTPHYRAQRRAQLLYVKDDQSNVDWEDLNRDWQLISSVTNDTAMTTKGNMISNLKAYSSAAARQPSGTHHSTMVKKTYRLYDKHECETFFNRDHKQADVWLVKPTHKSNGKGISIYTQDTLADLRAEHVNRHGECYQAEEWYPHRDSGEIVQEYLINPLLLNDRKSEIRIYWVVACTDPWILLIFNEGTVRMNSEPYVRGNWDDPLVHITNVYKQHSHPRSDEPGFFENLKWTFDKYQDYLVKEDKAEPDWVRGELWSNIKEYLVHVHNATKPFLMQEPGSFSLFGADFIVDDTMHPWLGEIQLSPGLSMEGMKRKLIPSMLKEMLNVVLEIQDKRQRGESLANLEGLTNFEVLVNEADEFFYSKPGV